MKDYQAQYGHIARRCLQTALAVAIFSTWYFWGSWLSVLLTWLAMPFVASILCYTCGIFLRKKLPIQEVEDKEEVLISGFSDSIVGKFRDTIIHEWVTIADPETGAPLKLEYETLVDDKFVKPNDRWVYINNGICYMSPKA